jgi:serine/threonine protein kinase/WD40 repeat protein
MPESVKCPECGSEISGEIGSNLCLQCLLRIGLGGAQSESRKTNIDSGKGAIERGANLVLRAKESNTSRFEAEVSSTEQIGDTIGHFRLLQVIGEGGFGIVYKAEQETPVRRQVALKIIKLGMDTRELVARFEIERQTLALMDHPHIAKVFDGGATRLGRPYFAMELVNGIPITRYCDENRLDLEGRLGLFMDVCLAIQHAHQKGIIHRDIKPSNVLIESRNGAPFPRVIDFGIAKAVTGQQLKDKTTFTAFEQFLGTPAYVSPEQARMGGVDIDTRSDIYSLGVLLYELLTGETPFGSKNLPRPGLDEMRRTIIEAEPPRPSVRLAALKPVELAALTRGRQALPVKWIAAVRGDLDWIVMKCLEKERGRRYETANGLALDIERYLKSEPILAHPPGSLYRIRKFTRRNKMAVAATALVAGTLLLGAVFSSWEARRAKSAELEQRRLREQAQERLYGSLVSEARALRLARPAGYRDAVFNLIRQAREIDPPRQDISILRSEAVGCLGDVVGVQPRTMTNFPTGTSVRSTALSPDGKLAGFLLSDGSVLLRHLRSENDAGRLRGPNRIASFCFGTAGNRIYTVHLYDPDNCPALETNRQAVVCVWEQGAASQWNATKSVTMPGAVRCLGSPMGAMAHTLDFTNHLAHLVDIETGREMLGLNFPEQFDSKRFPGYPEVALSPDGRIAAVESLEPTSAPDASIEVWNVRDRKMITRLRPRLGFLESLRFNGDGSFLGCLSQSGGALYDLTNNFAEYDFKGSFRSPSAVAFQPGLMVAGLPFVNQMQVRLWDWARKENVLLLREPSFVSQVDFNPKSNSMVTSGPGYARIYDLRQLPEKLSLSGHSAPVTGLAFSPDGRHLASVSADATVRVWDALTGASVLGPKSLSGPGQVVAYSPDANILAAEGFKNRAGPFWDADNGQQVLNMAWDKGGRIWAAQFSADGRYFASAGDAEVSIWSITRSQMPNEKRQLTLRLVKSVDGPATSLVFSPDSESVAFVDFFGSVNVWDVNGPVPPRQILGGVPLDSQALAFTADSRRLLVGRDSGHVVILDTASGHELSPALNLNWTIPNYVRFRLSPSQARLAVISQSNRGVEVWDFGKRALLYSLPEQDSAVEWLDWSPDSRRVAVARSDGDIEIWDLATVDDTLAQLGLQP